MTKQDRPSKLSESEAQTNITAMLASGRLEGIMTVIGQSGISVEAGGTAYPLPDGDYLVLRVSTRSAATPKVGWAPVAAAQEAIEPETEPEPA